MLHRFRYIVVTSGAQDFICTMYNIHCRRSAANQMLFFLRGLSFFKEETFWSFLLWRRRRGRCGRCDEGQAVGCGGSTGCWELPQHIRKTPHLDTLFQRSSSHMALGFFALSWFFFQRSSWSTGCWELPQRIRKTPHWCSYPIMILLGTFWSLVLLDTSAGTWLLSIVTTERKSLWLLSKTFLVLIHRQTAKKTF